MRNKRLLFVLAGAAVFGLLAAVSVSRYLSNAQAFSRNMNGVVVAKVDIPLGTTLGAEHLTAVQLPAGAVPEGAFNSAEKLVGRVAVVNVAAREPVTDFKLAPEGSVGGLSSVIPEGYRAMTVKVDDVIGVAGFLRPGAMCDVLTVIEQPGGDQRRPRPHLEDRAPERQGARRGPEHRQAEATSARPSRSRPSRFRSRPSRPRSWRSPRPRASSAS